MDGLRHGLEEVGYSYDLHFEREPSTSASTPRALRMGATCNARRSAPARRCAPKVCAFFTMWVPATMENS